MLLGGRTAEELIFADPTTGAQNDIDRATTIARQMVTEFGMSDALGPMRFGQPQGEVFLGRDFTSTPDYSEEVAARIDDEVRAPHRRRARRRPVEVLDRQPRRRSTGSRRALIEHETLEADQVAGDLRRRRMLGRRPPTSAARGTRVPTVALAPSRSTRRGGHVRPSQSHTGRNDP